MGSSRRRAEGACVLFGMGFNRRIELQAVRGFILATKQRVLGKQDRRATGPRSDRASKARA